MSEERIDLVQLIADEFGLARSEVRRLMVAGDVKVDGATPLSFDYPASSIAGRTLTVGKNRSMTIPGEPHA